MWKTHMWTKAFSRVTSALIVIGSIYEEAVCASNASQCSFMGESKGYENLQTFYPFPSGTTPYLSSTPQSHPTF